jgi:tetratricopeptide (TPR) repeat protein
MSAAGGEDPVVRQLWEHAQAQIRARRLPAAQGHLEHLLQRDPWHVPARLLLASVVLGQGRVRGAAEQLKYAAFALPEDPDLIRRVAQSLFKVGETVTARATLQHPAVARLRSGPALAALAHIHQGLGQHEQALEMMDRARACGMDGPDFRYFRAIQLQFNGRLAEAEAELVACLALGPTFGRASVTLARLHRWSAADNHLDFIAQRLGEVAQGTEDHAAFEFARYKELEDLGDHDAAWDALARANGLMHARLGYDGAAEEALFEAIAGTCDADFCAPQAHRFDGPQPIFIVGMPRSGTTLLERILGRHSQVTPAGELTDFPRQWRWVADRHGHALVDAGLLAAASDTDFAEVGRRYLEQAQWRAEGRPYFVDKLPPNFQLAGAIRRALPQARILHMRRDPMDLCFSNWRALFGDAFGYSYDLDALAGHHRRYRRLMAHWHAVMPGAIHDVDYAALAGDTEATARALLAYCGLPFEAGVLDDAGNAAPVATLSSVQVLGPIRARLAEWQPYARQLEPLRAALARDA